MVGAGVSQGVGAHPSNQQFLLLYVEWKPQPLSLFKLLQNTWQHVAD
jgi:hypothetical protein